MKGRTALITGSTAGLGLTLAATLAAEGCNVVMTGLGDPATIEAQRKSIADTTGGSVAYVAADLRSLPDIEHLVAQGRRTFGAVDILVNNAVSRHMGAVETFDPAHWDQDVAVNLTAAFNLIRLTLGPMKASGWGRIVNLSSNLGLFGAANRVSYVTTKTALIGLTRAIATETVGTRVTCNAICPSSMLGENAERQIVEIERSEGVSREIATEKFLAQRNRARFVTTVPAMICFLCSEHGKDMNGAAIPIDLGSSAGQPATAVYAA